MKITWLGDESAETNEWNGVVFSKGVPVEVTDERMIAKARKNQFYKVEEQTKETRHVETKDEESEKEQKEKPPSDIAQAFSPHQDESYKPIQKKSRKQKAKAAKTSGDPARLPAGTASDT